MLTNTIIFKMRNQRYISIDVQYFPQIYFHKWQLHKGFSQVATSQMCIFPSGNSLFLPQCSPLPIAACGNGEGVFGKFPLRKLLTGKSPLGKILWGNTIFLFVQSLSLVTGEELDQDEIKLVNYIKTQILLELTTFVNCESRDQASPSYAADPW